MGRRTDTNFEGVKSPVEVSVRSVQHPTVDRHLFLPKRWESSYINRVKTTSPRPEETEQIILTTLQRKGLRGT